MKQSPRWKATERAVAAHLRGERIPITGRHSDKVPDVKTPVFAVEVKHGAKYSAAWFHDLRSGDRLYGVNYVNTDKDGMRIHRLCDVGSDGTCVAPLRPSLAYTRKFPAWLLKAIGQAKAAGLAYNLRPLVVIHAMGTPVTESICLFP